MYELVLILVIAISSTYAGPKPTDLGIVGGHDTDISLHPWQISLRSLIEGNTHMCGGSIISNSWILTAVHCVDIYKPEQLAVTVGSTYLSSGGEEYTVKSIIQYPTSESDDDIALMQLSKPISNPNASIISLPSQDEDLPITNYSVTGWGRTSEFGPNSEILQEALIPLVLQDVCRKAYPSISEQWFCLGDMVAGKVDSCYGDSGGPAVTDNKVFGIVSYGRECGDAKNPGVYVKVPYYVDWIKNITGIV